MTLVIMHSSLPSVDVAQWCGGAGSRPDAGIRHRLAYRLDLLQYGMDVAQPTRYLH